ncbi:hypothetical protein [Glutamicibacter arilaitensis]|uniref:hypothetical protein n=1 Tax=Glutamicibacter arilaitensis TaxID=256701 RepID=UPI003FD65B53
MADGQERIDKLTAAERLASADQASNKMVAAGTSSRATLFVYVVLGSIAMSLEHVLSPKMALALFAVAVVAALVHYVIMCSRAKMRPLLSSSATYGWYAFLASMIVMCLRFWVAEDPWSIGAKLVVSCTALWHLLSAAQTAWDKDRVQDAQEMAV